MKQKIVMKVEMNCLKCRSKAMEIAASTYGVDSVAIQGNDEDQVVVVGEEVDLIFLVGRLRKKVGHTQLISVEEVKPKEVKEEKEPPEKTWYHTSPQFVAWECVYYEPPPPTCSIM